MLFSVVFKSHTKKLVLTFDDITKLEKFCTKAKHTFPDLEYNIFNRTKASPPPNNYKPIRGKLWCPYCAAPRRFFNGFPDPKKYKVCEVCTMSDADFYVKKYNNLWPTVVTDSEGNVTKRRQKRRKQR